MYFYLFVIRSLEYILLENTYTLMLYKIGYKIYKIHTIKTTKRNLVQFLANNKNIYIEG